MQSSQPGGFAGCQEGGTINACIVNKILFKKANGTEIATSATSGYGAYVGWAGMSRYCTNCTNNSGYSYLGDED